MTILELVTKLRELKADPEGNPEGRHVDADELLLDYINDPDVRAAFEDIEKWYA